MTDTPNDENFGTALGGAMRTSAHRARVLHLFDREWTRVMEFAFRTNSDSRYKIELSANGTPERFVYGGTTYWIRPGAATVNGSRIEGYVGFNLHDGTFLVLERNKAFVRRSSSIDIDRIVIQPTV